MTALLSLALCVAFPQAPQPSAWKQVSSPIINGWMEFKASGVRISFPSTWNAVDPKTMPKAAASILPTSMTKIPGLSKAIEKRTSAWRMFVVDNNISTPGYRSMAGLQIEPIKISVVDHLRVSKRYFTAAGIPAEIYYIDLPTGRAGLIESTLKMTNGATLDAYTFIIHRKSSEYRITFAEDAAKGKSMQQLARTIIKTLRFTS